MTRLTTTIDTVKKGSGMSPKQKPPIFVTFHDLAAWWRYYHRVNTGNGRTQNRQTQLAQPKKA